MKKSLMILCLLALFSSTALKPIDDFIVKQPEKKTTLSKNKLKERIGSTLKDAMDSTSTLVKTYGTLLQASTKCQVEEKERSASMDLIGSILSEISALQKRFSLSVERLIDNRRPFKTASRDQLSQTKDILADAAKKLSDHEKACGNFVHDSKAKKSAFAATVKNQCQAWHSELSLINSRLACNDCLR